METTLKRRKIEELDDREFIFPLDLWYEIIPKLHWTILLSMEYIKDIRELVECNIEKQIKYFVEQKLPKMCFGTSSKKKGMVDNDNGLVGPAKCSHQRKNQYCLTFPFVPHYEKDLFSKDGSIFNNKNIVMCPLTNTIQRPTKRRQHNIKFGVLQHMSVSVTEEYFNDNPKWLCSVKPIKRKRNQTYIDLFCSVILPDIMQQLSKMTNRCRKQVLETYFHESFALWVMEITKKDRKINSKVKKERKKQKTNKKKKNTETNKTWYQSLMM